MDSTIIFEIEPIYNFLCCAIESKIQICITSVAFALVAGAIFNLLSVFIFLESGNMRLDVYIAHLVCIAIVIIAFLVMFPVCLVIHTLIKKYKYKSTKYIIKTDKIEFYENFINSNNKSVEINDIKEIHLVQNFVQKKFNVATIEIMTEASNSYLSTGILIENIKNYESIYNKIKQLKMEYNNGK